MPLCLAPRRQVGLLTAWHVGRPKRILNAKVGFCWRRNWSKELLKIENTQPTAWVRRSENRKGVLKRGMTVGKYFSLWADRVPQALAHGGTSGFPGGSWSRRCLSVHPPWHRCRLRAGPRAVSRRHTAAPSPPEGRRELPGGCTRPSRSLLQRNGNGKYTSEISTVCHGVQALRFLSFRSFL